MYFKGDQSKLFITKDKTLNSTPIVFIHGFTGSSKSWKNIRKNLDYPSLAVDIPGHGQSSFNHLNEEYYFKDFTNELYLSLLSINIKKIHLCGYSMGGRLSFFFAFKNVDIINCIPCTRFSQTIGLTSFTSDGVYKLSPFVISSLF